MGSLAWVLYLAKVCDDINLACLLLLVFGGASFVVFCIARALEDERNVWFTWKPLRWLIIPAAIGTLTPDAKTLYLMAAVNAAQVTAATPQAQEVLTKALAALNAQLDALGGKK